MDILLRRGVSVASVEKFGLGLAPSRRSVALCGAGADRLEAAGLLIDAGDGLRDRFRARIMIPVHDARGHNVGFGARARSEEHTSELQSLMRISYAVFCLKKKNQKTRKNTDS